MRAEPNRFGWLLTRAGDKVTAVDDKQVTDVFMRTMPPVDNAGSWIVSHAAGAHSIVRT